MYRSAISQCAVLEYLDPCAELLQALPADSSSEDAEEVVVGVPEEEVERRVCEARAAAALEVEMRLRAELERERKEATEQMTRSLHQFAQERTSYFNRVEVEVVHLALAVARKILQRETALDPTLLAAMVRVALDRMQSGRPVKVFVPPAEVDRWRVLGQTEAGASHWEAFGDNELQPGDCVVETELGRAHFGFEAQIREIEESFDALLAHKPDRI